MTVSQLFVGSSCFCHCLSCNSNVIDFVFASESVWVPPAEYVSLAEQEGLTEQQPADGTQQVGH